MTETTERDKILQMPDPRITVDPRDAKAVAFRRHLAPLLALGDQHPDATELVVDGHAIRLDLGDRWQHYSFTDFLSLSPRSIHAAASAAAVFAGRR